MKKLFISAVAIILLFSCSEKQTNGYTINGSIENLENGKKVFLRKFEQRKPIDIDSSTVENGEFLLTGAIENPDVYFIFIEDLKGNIPMILENKELSITAYKDSLNMSMIEGSSENDLARDYMQSVKAISQEAQELSKQFAEARKNQDTAFMKTYQAKRQEINQKNIDLTKKYIEESTNNVFGLVLLENFFMSNRLKLDETQELFTSYSDEAKNSGPGLRIKEQIDKMLATEIGSKAPNFTAKSPEGKDISLSDIKGKITIVDFWAAWCRPCRLENPNLVRIYNKYHDKGLEIIGVSLDGNPRQKDAKQEWIEAIEKDRLTWYHVSNLNYFNGPIAQAYNIRSIPASFILDGEGKIIAKNLRGKAMEDKISELLD